MKRILLFVSLFLLVSCESLVTPPLETPEDFTVYQPSQTPTDFPTIPPTSVVTETPTSLPRPTSTPIPTYAPYPPFPEGVLPGEMVSIPAGSFLMGCDPATNGNNPCPPSELPQREVSLDAFQISRYEVTNEEYRACVITGRCDEPLSHDSKTRSDYYNDPAYAYYPVVNVNFKNAQQYCGVIGGRLPTEAEWEYAARGNSGNLYPWGDDAPDCSQANSYNNTSGSSCVGDTVAVGSYPLGESPFGLNDMAGNVWEWVSDYYAPDAYSSPFTDNPSGPASSSERVVRGGGWSGSWHYLRTTSRAYDLYFYSGVDLGFRCVVPIYEP